MKFSNLKIFGSNMKVIACVTLITAGASPAAATGAQVVDLPSCESRETLGYVRSGLETIKSVRVLGLHGAREIASIPDEQRTCTVFVVTVTSEQPLAFKIGWHDRELGIPYFTGDQIK